VRDGSESRTESRGRAGAGSQTRAHARQLDWTLSLLARSIRYLSILSVALLAIAGCKEGPPDEGRAAGTTRPDSATPLPTGTLIFANRVVACGAPGRPDCSEVKDRNLELWRLDLAGGKTGAPARLTSNSNGRPDDPTCRDADDDLFLATSPDGTTVFVLNRLDGDDDIYALPVSGGEARNLTANTVDDAYVGLSPDGTRLFFANRSDGDADLYAVDPRGGPAQPVLSSTSDEHFLAVAGRRVFYTVLGPDGRKALLSRPLGGGRSVRLSPEGDEFTSFGAVSTDGGHVFFDARSGNHARVLAAPADGSGPAVVLSANRDSALFRLLSPDGKTVVFTANDRPLAGGGAGDVEIYAVPADGSGAPRLLTAFENDSYFLPRRFTSDGQALLYESPVDGDIDIYRLPLDGGPPTNLTKDSPGTDRLLGVAAGGLLVSRNGGDLGLDDELLFLDSGGAVFRLTSNDVPDMFCAFLPGGEG